MEVKDTKTEVVNALEAKWESGTLTPRKPPLHQ